MKPHFKKLKKLNACSEAISWAEKFDTIEEVIDSCDRGDWLLWLAKRLDVDNRKLTLAKGYCANTVRHLMKDERSLKAVDVAIAYGEGKATKEQLSAAYNAAAYVTTTYAFDTNDDDAHAAHAATYATHAATYAATAAATAAATYAAYAAIHDCASYDTAAARKNNQLQTAEICRRYLRDEILNSWKTKRQER